MKPGATNPLVLLGAGASKPAGIPMAVEMTERMLQFCHDEDEADYGRALNALAHMLKISGGNPVSTGCADVESVMNAAHFLANRSELEFAPFVGAWHPIIEDLERQRQKLTRAKAQNFVKSAVEFGACYTSSDNIRPPLRGELPLTTQSLDATLHSLMGYLDSYISPVSDGALFRDLITYLTGKLVEITFKKNDEKLEYLSPLLERGQKSKITIATLNYDNCIERRALSLNIPCSTGLAGWAQDGTFPEISEGIDLIKLHGSITWFFNGWKDPLGLNERPIWEMSDDRFLKIMDESQQERGHSGQGYDQAFGKQLAVIFGGHKQAHSRRAVFRLIIKI